MKHWHMWAIAGAVWAIGESFRDQASKARIPVLGSMPTLMKGPDPGKGLLDQFLSKPAVA